VELAAGGKVVMEVAAEGRVAHWRRHIYPEGVSVVGFTDPERSH
jgi:hypothetical protein